jgi:hypothetical protein
MYKEYIKDKQKHDKRFIAQMHTTLIEKCKTYIQIPCILHKTKHAREELQCE